jgi:hypothetical protein
MGLNQLSNGKVDGWSLIEACEGMAASQGIPSGSWALEVGRTEPGKIIGPILASFDSSQLTGEAPYLIAVVIGPDVTATIEQRSSLPADPARTLC